MSFGKNPHVAKAQAAEQKAQVATDEAARKLAWREAARLWDRAAEREQQRGGNAARGQSYLDHAEAARAAADGDPEADSVEETAPTSLTALTALNAQERPPESATDSKPKRWLN